MKLKIAKTAELEQQTSAEIVVSIDDLFIKILQGLPIKSLACFKTVSKRWLSIITNPRISVLFHPNPNPAIGLFLPSNYEYSKNDYVHFDSQKKHTTKPPFKEIEFPNDTCGITVVQSCNGLLLCSSFRYRYYVYNPTTKHHRTLPKPAGAAKKLKIHGINLAFDPAKSIHYKVVCVLDSLSSPQHYQIEIYSSETGLWRRSGEPFTSDIDGYYGVYWNGSIHWISFMGELSGLRYNVDLERLGVMPVPHLLVDQDPAITYFGESCDHLHLIKFNFPKEKFDVYELKRDYSEWFVKYKVDLEPLAASLPGMINTAYEPYEIDYYNFYMPSLVRGGREKDAFLVLVIGNCKVIRYNLLSKSFEELYDCEDADEQVSDHRAGGAFVYIESLCCV